MANKTYYSNLFPVPDKEELILLSSQDELNKIFDDLEKSLNKTIKILLVVMVVLFVLAMIPSAAVEIWGWRMVNKRANLLDSIRTENREISSKETIVTALNPLAVKFGRLLTRKTKSQPKKIKLRWLVSYITHPPALTVLLLGIAALMVAAIQSILLHKLVEAQPKINDALNGYEGDLKQKIANASLFWADGTNRMINDSQNTINDDLFGWVETSTTSLNNSLNIFVDDLTSILNSTFSGTILYNPVLDVINCLILVKIRGIEKGLQYAHDNAHVTFPLVENNLLSSLSESTNDENNSLGTNFGDILGWITKKWQTMLVQQIIFACILLSMFMVVVLMGFIRLLYLKVKPFKQRGNGAGIPLVHITSVLNNTGTTANVHPGPRRFASKLGNTRIKSMIGTIERLKN